METLRARLDEQKARHQGGNKWVGTAGTSPFGAYGYNPEGVRIGQDGSRHQRAVKVWDKREFRNLDDQVELGTRNIKVALRRLRRWARDGAAGGLGVGIEGGGDAKGSGAAAAMATEYGEADCAGVVTGSPVTGSPVAGGSPRPPRPPRSLWSPPRTPPRPSDER